MSYRTSIFGIADEVEEVVDRKGEILTDDGGLLYGIPPGPNGTILTADSYSHGGLKWVSIGSVVGAGDVDGPTSSTDNAIVRFDGTTGKLIQDSTVSIDDIGNIATGDITLNAQSGTDFALKVQSPDGNGQVIGAYAQGEALPRFRAYTSGALNWGTGAAIDLRLFRNGANTMRIDGNSGNITMTVIGTVAPSVGVVVAANSGTVFSAGTSDGTNGSTATPPCINLGDTFYSGNGWDRAGLKLRFFDNTASSSYLGIGPTNGYLNYVNSNNTEHVFWVNASDRLRITPTATAIRGSLTTIAGDMTITSATSTVSFSNKNITGSGTASFASYSSGTSAGNKYYTYSTTYGIGAGTNQQTYFAPSGGYHNFLINNVSYAYVDAAESVFNNNATNTGVRFTNGITSGSTASNIMMQAIASGFETIVFNGKFSGTETVYNTGRRRWRLGHDGRTANNDQFFIESYDGTTSRQHLIVDTGSSGVAGTQNWVQFPYGLSTNLVRAQTGSTIDFNGSTLSNCTVASSSISGSEGTTTASSVYWTGTVSIRYYKIGKMCTIEVWGTPTCTSPTYSFFAPVGTVPAGYRPTQAIAIRNELYTINVGSAGDVSVRKPDSTMFATSDVLGLSGTYLTATFITP